jgi:hypothetical protein
MMREAIRQHCRMATLFGLFSIVASGCGKGADPVAPTSPDATPSFTYHYTERHDPTRTDVYDEDDNWVATFTDDAYTVIYHGPERTFVQDGDTVRTDIWVRIYTEPYDGQIGTAERAWLTDALADTSADIQALGTQYIAGAPNLYDGSLRIAGDAAYGDGIGADFNDFLGISWTYSSGTVDQPESSQYGQLDCSGFVRMLFGYRGTPDKIPLTLTSTSGTMLPRTSYNQYLHGTGVILIENTESDVPDSTLSVLQPGDVLFFDSSSRETPGNINHVGIYMGEDTNGRPRFMSSLPSADGPVFGRSSGSDFVLDGTGFWSDALRAARRL